MKETFTAAEVFDLWRVFNNRMTIIMRATKDIEVKHGIEKALYQFSGLMLEALVGHDLIISPGKFYDAEDMKALVNSKMDFEIQERGAGRKAWEDREVKE